MHKALEGIDYVRDKQWNPAQKTKDGWIRYAETKAKKMSKRDNVLWFGVVAYIASRRCYRISYASLEDKTYA